MTNHTFASPIATGGGGVALESRIAAYYLSSMLVAGSVRGLPTCVASTVKLQRAFEARPLDDIIVAANGPEGPLSLDLQAKRTVSVGDNDIFNDVIDRCWHTFERPSFRNGHDRFGFVPGTETRDDARRQQTLLWAQHSANAADFFDRLRRNRVSSASMRTFVDSISSAIAKSAGRQPREEETWQFLKHLVIIPFDFERADASRDRLHAIERLSHALRPGSQGCAPDLWQALVGIADDQKAAAGSLNRNGLLERLGGQFEIEPARQVINDIQKIRDASRRALGDIANDIGGVRLPRLPLFEKVLDQARGGCFIEIIGDKGSGKSAILRNVAETQAQHAPIIVLKPGQFPNDPGWEGLASYLRLENSLELLIDEAGCASQPCLFIDGIDRIQEAGTWAMIRDLFEAIARSPGVGRWTIVTTARAGSTEYRASMPSDALPSFNQISVKIGELEGDEVGEVARALPHLAPFIQGDGLAVELARRPYFLNRLAKSPRLIRRGPQQRITEIDLMEDIWLDDGGGGGTQRRQRQDVLLDIGKRRLGDRSHKIRSIGLNPTILEHLIREEIIQEDNVTRVVGFTHDILEDWTISQVFDHQGVEAALVQAQQTPWLYDALQLLAVWKLERATDDSSWTELLNQVSTSGLEPRWRRAVLTAPLRSTRAFELMHRLEPFLLAGKASLLRELLLAVRTTEVDPLPEAIVEALEPHGSAEDRITFAIALARPRWSMWRPLIVWLLPRLRQLPAYLVDDVARVLEVPMAMGEPLPKSIAEPVAPLALYWLRLLEARDYPKRPALESRLAALEVVSDDRNSLADRLRNILIASGKNAPAPVKHYLKTIMSRRRYQGAAEVISWSNYLAPFLPQELADFCLRVLISSNLEKRLEFRGVMEWNDLGVDRFGGFLPPSHLRPPFLQLLRSSPTDGIRLINGLCQASMEVWRNLHQWERDRRGTPLPIAIAFPWGERQFWGHFREYTWFRGTGPGPYPVMSSLMALEVWMEEQVAGGRDLAELFRFVLEGNDCVGAVGACISICLANPDKALEAAIPFVCHPMLWRYDLNRTVQDGQGVNANTLGIRPNDKFFCRANYERNKLPHRRLCLRDLVCQYLFTHIPCQSEFLARMGSLEQIETMAEFVEQLDNPAVQLEWREHVHRMASTADRANWRLLDGTDTGQFMIQYEHPDDLKPAAKAQGCSVLTT